jgi:hypothetical protein
MIRANPFAAAGDLRLVEASTSCETTCMLLHLPVAAFLGLLAQAACLTLYGYCCPSCPSAADPNALLKSLHPAYTHVALAFIGWDETGALVNQWDAPNKGFILNKTIVAGLQAKGVRVLMSLGGGAGNVLPAPSDPNFADTMLAGLIQLHSTFGVDGFDWDLENFGGTDPIADMLPVLTVVTGLKAQIPGLL